MCFVKSADDVIFCLYMSVCKQDKSKSCRRILIKISEWRVVSLARKTFDFVDDPDHDPENFDGFFYLYGIVSVVRILNPIS